MTDETREALRKKIVALALSQVGTREEGGNNLGKEVRQYQEATWLDPGPWPWCAAFTCWILHEALRAVPGTNLPGCQDASAFGWEKWGRKNGCQIFTENDLAKAGDFVIFDFSHIGVVVKDQKPGSLLIDTVEGNTNGKGDRDSESGDGVWKKIRAKSLTKCYVRI